jgi:hypothetical protein
MSSLIPVGYGSVTPPPIEHCCPVCGTRPDNPRATYCSDRHRQLAYRRRRSAPSPPPQRLPQHLVVYQCPRCEERFLGTQRCQECNVWCRSLGAGGPCLHCYQPVAVSDLLAL